MTVNIKKKRKLPVQWEWIVIISIVVLSIAFAMLFYVSPVPKRSTYSLNMDSIRKLAASMPGALPQRVNMLTVGETSVPLMFTTAGAGFSSTSMVYTSYQIVYPDHTIAVDSNMSAKDAGANFNQEKFDAQQAALRDAELILLTHEHYDHIGGITASPYLNEILPKVVLIPEMVDTLPDDWTDEMLAQVQMHPYELYEAVAPGVVMIKAPGHTPGGQMIYVKLQDGSELLLVGDVIWNRANIDRLKGRPLFASLILFEDWNMQRQQVRTLYDLALTEPVSLVISHDKDQLNRLVEMGLLHEGFE